MARISHEIHEIRPASLLPSWEQVDLVYQAGRRLKETQASFAKWRKAALESEVVKRNLKGYFSSLEFSTGGTRAQWPLGGNQC